MIRTKWFKGTDDLSEVHGIRRKVFIEEQNVSEKDEMDGTDPKADHLLVYDGDMPVATGRIVKDGNETVLGRIAVLKEQRGNKYGDLVVRMLIRKAFDEGADKQYVHSQISARGFYEKLGFKAYGEEYPEAGILHINMWHEGDVFGSCGS